MDHLPFPTGYDPPEVPYLIDPLQPYVYDNVQSMLQFPARMGWTINELEEFDKEKIISSRQHTRLQAASLIQAWLYFGLIHIVTRLPVITSEYVRLNKNGMLVISTSRLPEHLIRWQQSIKASSEQENSDYITGTDIILARLKHFFITLVGHDDRLLPPTVSFSMVILLKTLILAKIRMFPNSQSLQESLYGNYNNVIRAKMVSLGWCEAEVNYMGQIFSSITQLYISSLGQRLSFRDHSSCKAWQCMIAQVDNKKYIPRHTSTNCSCELLYVDESKVTQSVQEDHIPLVSLDGDSKLQITTIPLNAQGGNEAYIALSHIWADGLGNPNGNAIHLCQAKFLQESVNEVAARKLHNQSSATGRTSFWMDTLCVPATDGEFKTKAIASMERVYKKAMAVLVLDRDLVNIAGVSALERAIRITVSPWWTRLWTIQEGAFAKELYFQFKDGAVLPSDLHHPDREESYENMGLKLDIADLVVRDALSEFFQLSSLSEKIKADRGRHLLRNIGWRFSSRNSDEVICLAILRGLDVPKIAKYSDKDLDGRMREFIVQQKYFPSSVIFGNDSNSRLKEPGFRWAPRTYLGRTKIGDVTFHMRNPDTDNDRNRVLLDEAAWDKSGLHVTYFGFTLALGHIIQAQQGTDGRKLDVFNETDQGHYKMTLLSEGETNASTWDALRDTHNLAVILPRQFGIQTRALGGVLVSIRDPDDPVLFSRSELFCSYIHRVLVFYFPGNPFSNEDLEQRSQTLGRAQSMDMNQRWCVD